MSSIILPPAHGVDVFQPSRRRFMQAMAGSIASIAVPVQGQVSEFWSLPRELWLIRPATGEEVREVYWADGALIESGYLQICRLLRDAQRNKAVQFDLVTLDIARGLCGWMRTFGINKPLIINSGYRHPLTNASEGGVRNSLHTMAKAIDVRIEGVSVESVTRFGMYLAGGGVGFYPGKQFTHVDSGRIRQWAG